MGKKANSYINPNYNVFYDKYDDSDYKTIELTDIQYKRYNEKLNSDKISYAIENLNLILDLGKVYEYGIVEYAMLYADTLDYLYEQNIVKINGEEYISISYMDSLIHRLFNMKIDYKEAGFKIKGDYIKLVEVRQVNTDVNYMYIKNVKFNEKDNTYLVEILQSSNDYEYNLDNVEEIEKNSYAKSSIRYRKNSNIPNTILEYRYELLQGEEHE